MIILPPDIQQRDRSFLKNAWNYLVPCAPEQHPSSRQPIPALPRGPTYSCISLQRTAAAQSQQQLRPAVPSGRVTKATRWIKLWFHLAKQQKFQKWRARGKKTMEKKKKKPLWHVSISTLQTEISWLASSLHCTGILNPPGSNNFEDTPRRVKSGAGTKTPNLLFFLKNGCFPVFPERFVTKITYFQDNHTVS